jgi:signal transduction histidine kinase
VTADAAASPWAAYDLPLSERQAAATAPEGHPLAEGDRQLLLYHVRWFCRLRWLVIAALAALALLAWTAHDRLLGYGVRIEAGWPLEIAVVLALANVAYLAVARAAARAPQRGGWAIWTLWFQIALDLALLTVVVHHLGSLETYAPFMYLFHIVLACIFFPYAQSLLVTLSAMGMYAGCVLLEGAGIVPPQSVLAGTLEIQRSGLPRAVLLGNLGSVVFISGTVWYLASRLAGALRRRDLELAATNRRLAAAMDERARYMLRTTHQLKAPFAAIHANAQLLLGGYCGPLPERAVAVVEQVAARCDMLSREIKAMLQLANLRSHALAPPAPEVLDLPLAIQSCLGNLRPQAARRGIAIDEDLAPASVCMVSDYLTMIVENVLSNAVNYSLDGQRLSVSCAPQPGGRVRMVVRDHGIGIPAEKLPRIFDDYFRTSEAAAHNRASSGLGLAIVRQAAMAGKVGVRVESAPAQGTLFCLDFPGPVAPERPD